MNRNEKSRFGRLFLYAGCDKSSLLGCMDKARNHKLQVIIIFPRYIDYAVVGPWGQIVATLTFLVPLVICPKKCTHGMIPYMWGAGQK